MMKSMYVWVYCTLYRVCVITSGRTRVAAAEEDAFREQQAEADAVVEQQLKRMQSGRNSVWPCKTSARQRHYHTRRVRVGGCARLMQLLWLLHHEELQVPVCQTAHVGKQRAVVGAGVIGEQVANKQATCRGYYSCCTVLLLFWSLLHYKICYVWVLGWTYYRERGFSKNAHPLFEQPHNLITNGHNFERLQYLYVGIKSYKFLRFFAR